MTWNPFTKAVGERLTEVDLRELLGRVAEGYHVEYKADFPAPKKIAHSIASLANTYGGWYIVGVKTDQLDVASEILGISLADHQDPVSKIRDVVKTRVDPVPVFYPMTIPLENGRLVLAVYVPGEQRTPFITDDGRVYRRNHASSDPVPEQSRHTLDQLFENGKRSGRRFVEFCERTEKIPPKLVMPYDVPIGWFNLFLALESAPSFRTDETKTVEELLEITKRSHPFHIVGGEGGTGNIPFKSGHTTPNSIVLRQSDPWSLPSAEITAEFTLDGYARLSVPVPHSSVNMMGPHFSSQQASVALERLSAADDSLAVFDGSFLPIQALIFTSLYRTLHAPADWSPDLRVALSLHGLGGAAPFVDVDRWGEQVTTTGVPLLEDTIRSPVDWNETLTLPFDENSAIYMAVLVSRALGLHPEVAFTALAKIGKRSHKAAD